MASNAAWADGVIARFDPSFRHRWVIYEDALQKLLMGETTWLDIGAGDAGLVARFGTYARRAVAVDFRVPVQVADVAFVCCDLRALPFMSGVADLVTLRFVAEHLRNTPEDLREIVRVLKPGGHLLVLTTNVRSPFIFLPRLLPYWLKRAILKSVFNVCDEDVFPTYHRFNSMQAMRNAAAGLELQRLDYLQDANPARRWVFALFFAWHLLTRPHWLQRFRTNILAVFVKSVRQPAAAPLHTSLTPQPPKH